MASWLSREIDGDEDRLPPLKQKSKIPVRVTRLSSDSEKSSSSEDEGDKKQRLPRDSVDKLQTKRPSRIPIVVNQKKNKIDKKKLPVATVKGEKPLGRDSGINLRETRQKQARTKTSTSSPNAAKSSSRKPGKESTPLVRRRIPRQLTPLETKQVSKDEKEPRNETSVSDSSSAARTGDVTPDFECNIARVEDGDLLTGAESNISGSEFEDDFERYSISSDEQAMPNVPPWLRGAVKERKIQEQKAAEAAEEEKESSKGATVSMLEPGAGHEDIHEDPTVNTYPAPKDICTDFIADELDKIVAELSVMNADMTDEEHADAMAALLLLRDEARERDDAAKDTKHEINEDKNVVKDDATITSSVNDAGNPEFETVDNMHEKAASEEEFDCSSVTVSSEGERKIAALDEKARQLKAQFAEENRQAIESMNKILAEIKQSQAREDAITDEMKEMRQRQDELSKDLKRLDKISKKRERDEKKWREKSDKRKKKIASRLERFRVQDIEAENENSENQHHPVTKNATERQEDEKCKDSATKRTKSCSNEDLSNQILYEPHEVKEYTSVKQLEKKRKEQRRLERMEKKAIKREKLEQRERKKIEKEKRKTARKLEKLRAKNSAVPKENLESSECVNNQPVGVSSASQQGNIDEPPNINHTEQQNIQVIETCDGDEIEHDASNTAGDQVAVEEYSSLHSHGVQTSITGGERKAPGNEHFDTCEDIVKTPVLESNTSVLEVPELGPEKAETFRKTSFKLEKDNSMKVGTDGFVEEEVDKKPSSESDKEYSKAFNHSDEEQKRIIDDNQMVDEFVSDDVEVDCLEKEDTLKDVSVELFSIEEELNIQPQSDLQGEGEPAEKQFLSHDCAAIPVSTEYDEAFSLQGKIDVDKQCANDGRAVMSQTTKDPTSEQSVEQIIGSYSSDKELSQGGDKASVQLQNQPGLFITNSSTLESAPEGLDVVWSEMTQHQISPEEETVMKTNDFIQHDGGYDGLDDPVQCPIYEQICVDEKEVSTRSKDEQSLDGDSDGSEVPEEYVANKHADPINMTLESEDDYGDEDPHVIRSSSPVTNEPSPLVRKPSGRSTASGLQPFFQSPDSAEGEPIFDDMDSSMQDVEENVQSKDSRFPFDGKSSPFDYEEVVTPSGLQPFLQSPETAESDPICDDMDSSIQDVEENVLSEDSRFPVEGKSSPLDYEEVVQHLETTSIEDEGNSPSNACDMSFNNLPRGIQEALLQQRGVCTDDDGDKKVEVEIIYEEVSRRSSDPNSFSFVCEEVSLQNCEQEGLMEQDIEAVIDDASLHEPFSDENEERLLTFVQQDDVDIPIKEATVDVCEIKTEMEKNETKVDDGCDHGIVEKVMELEQPPGTASESLSGGSSPLHVPRLLASSAESDDNSELPEELEEAVPVKEAAFPTTNLETLANSDHQSGSPRTTYGKHVYNAQKIANNTSDEDDFIAEFDDFLDEVEDQLETEESIDGTKIERGDRALLRARVEYSGSKIQELHGEENKEVRKSISVDDTSDEPDFCGSFNDMLSSGTRSVAHGKERSPFEIRDVCNVDTEGSNQKIEVQENETTELDARSPSLVETSTPALPQERSDSLPFPCNNERFDKNIIVTAEQVKPPNDQACTLEVQHGNLVFELSEGLDTWGPFYDLALPTGHQDISLPQVHDKARVVGEEFKPKLAFDKPSALHITTANDSNCEEDNKKSATDVRAAGCDEVPVESTMDQRFDISLKDVSPAGEPSMKVTQLPYAATRCLSEKGKVEESKHNEDEFIDDFDRFLDEVEEDIRIEESMSSSRSNPQSPMSNKIVEENDDESSAYVDAETLDESFTSVTDVASDKSLLTSCDEEVEATNDGLLQAISEEDEDPDSWDALDDVVDRHFRNRKSCVQDTFVINDGEDQLSDERQYERSKAAVVNISEHLLFQELLGAFEVLMEHFSLCGSSPRNGISSRTNDYLTKAPIRTDGKRRVDVTTQATGVIDLGERATVAYAIEEVDKLHSKVADIRKQLSGRTATKVQRSSLKLDVDSAPVLLDSIRRLDGNIGDLAEEFKNSTEKWNKASRDRGEDFEMEIVRLKKENAKMLKESRKENAKLLVQITVMQEEVEARMKKNETLHNELEATKVDLKRLQSREEYKNREMTNLKNDFERKEKKWEEAEECLENALTEKQELLDDVDYLEDSLRDSRECNEQLNAQVDGLNETIKELRKKVAMGKKRHDYGHLREEIELLKGSMELSNHSEKVLKCQVDALETEVSYHRNCKQTFKRDFKTLEEEKSMIIDQLKEQLATAEIENTRMIAELSKMSDRDEMLSELKDENTRAINQLEDQLIKLTEENSMLTMELSEALDKTNELTELRGETSRVIKQLEDQLAKLEKENSKLTTEVSKVAEKDKQLAELKKENSTLKTELAKIANKDRLLTELCEQVENLRNQNKFLQDEALEAKKRFVNELRGSQDEISEVWDDSVLSRKSRHRKNSDIKMLRKRVRQNEQEIEFLGRFIRQRGLEYGERPRYNIDQDLKDEPRINTNVKDNLNYEQENERDQQRKRQVQEMEKVIEDLRKSLRQTESDLEQTKGALTLKTERTDFLERRVEEKEMLVEETSKRLKQNEYKLQQTEATLKVQLERAENLQNQLKDMEKLRETSVTAVVSKEQELENAYRNISKKDEKIDDLIHELNQERSDKECLKKAIKVTENNAAREKALLEKIRELEDQLQKTGEMKQTTLAFLMHKEQELEQVKLSLNNKDVQIDGLIKELKQEKSDKDCLKKAIADTECKSNREEELLERVIELETQIQEMEDLREETLTSLKSKKQALEEAHVKISELNLELKREKSDKESLRSAVEVMECNANREKELLERVIELETQIQEMEELREETLTSLKSKEQALEEAHVKIDELNLELKREKSDKESLRSAVEVMEYNPNREKELLERVIELETQIQEMEELREETLTSLKSKEQALEEAHVKINELNLELKREKSDKESLRSAVEVMECNTKREKKLLERVIELETQIQEMEDLREETLTSLNSKEQALEEAHVTIDELNLDLKREKSDKESLRSAVEVMECSANREKELLERVIELETQIQEMEDLREETLISLNNKEQALEQSYVKIDELNLNLKREKSDKESLRRAVEVLECNTKREKELLEVTRTELENQLRDIEKLQETTQTSFKSKEQALEQGHVKINELNLELKREKLDKESLKRKVEVMECNAKREKELLESTRAELENQLRDMEKLHETTQKSLKSKEQELQQVYSSISRKDVKIDDLTQELKQERSEIRELRKAMDISESKAHQQRLLLHDKEKEVDGLNELLCDYERKIENLNVDMKQMRNELEIAEELVTYRQNDVGNTGISSRVQNDRLDVFPIRFGRIAEKSFREIGSLMGHVGERLKKILQRQKEVDASAILLKQNEAETGRILDRLRGELKQRDDEIESLKTFLGKSVNHGEYTRSRLRDLEHENIDLKRCLGDECDKVKKLEMTVKQLEGDLQRGLNSLKEKETTLEETKESLQLKGSLLASMEGKLYLRDHDIESLTLANKERDFELERLETYLKEVKKELEISTSIVTKQNEELVYLKSCAKRKTRGAEEVKFRVQPTQDELKLLSIRLESAKNEKANLSRELASAAARLENEQVMADKQKKALQEQVNSGLKDLKTKTKLIWDMKMRLQESTARITRLEAEKLEQDRCFRDYKRKLARGVKRLKQSSSSANENENLLQSRIGSTGREMSELRRENQRLNIELLQNEIGESSQDGEEVTSSGLCKETNLEAKRQEAVRRLKNFESEIKGDMTTGRHGDVQRTSDTRMEGQHLDKCVLSRGAKTFNSSAVLPAGDRIARDPTTPRSANKISILLCAA